MGLRRNSLLTPIDTDSTLAASSHARVPSQSAVKSYVDGASAESTGIIYIGNRNTNGSWRIRVNGIYLITEKRTAGVWVETDGASGKVITR